MYYFIEQPNGSTPYEWNERLGCKKRATMNEAVEYRVQNYGGPSYKAQMDSAKDRTLIISVHQINFTAYISIQKPINT